MEKIIGLKEFRENVNEYVSQIRKGKSFIVVKRSKPIFRVAPIEDETEEGQWETVVDFTKMRRDGVPAGVLLKYLRNGRNPKKPKKA